MGSTTDTADCLHMDRDALRAVRDAIGPDAFLATIRPLVENASIPDLLKTLDQP